MGEKVFIFLLYMHKALVKGNLIPESMMQWMKWRHAHADCRLIARVIYWRETNPRVSLNRSVKTNETFINDAEELVKPSLGEIVQFILQNVVLSTG